MKLICTWRCCYKLYSVQLGVLLVLLGVAQLELLPMWQAQLSDRAYATLNSVLALLLTVVRLIKQGPPDQGASS
ncbi:hypothetical protein BLL42_23670 [Pseudomonas frederiksbergensis]|uniref:Holin n=1 Tax=Pseudomonas frederiksbergensis TaxID=104087 RepID=A0A1J0ERI6_9PSED|nr:hypothetical protein [Pseudomonas frederiksbergensis]APC18563.1 hypothetical protein BLL42_23670 [Pseudomonas frederiksbergensis]